MLCQRCGEEIAGSEIHRRFPPGTREGAPLLYDVVIAHAHRDLTEMYEDLVSLGYQLPPKNELTPIMLWRLIKDKIPRNR